MQASENDRQRRYRKVWDKVLNDYGKGSIGLEMCGDGLLYALVIVIVLNKVVVGLEQLSAVWEIVWYDLDYTI